MIRTTSLAALTLALMSASAFAQTNAAPNGPPAQLSSPDSNYDDRDDGPDQRYDQRYDQRTPPQRTAEEQRSRDLFCRRDAAARTGYVTPGQAAGHEQANGSIIGTLGGAAVGALIGGAAGNAGAGAAIGAGQRTTRTDLNVVQPPMMRLNNRRRRRISLALLLRRPQLPVALRDRAVAAPLHLPQQTPRRSRRPG